jgi:tyrosyl-tRNA synthetase
VALELETEIQGIPEKGITLTTLSLFWFHKLAHIIPNHVLTPSIKSDSPTALSSPTQAWEEFPRSLDEYRDQLEGRSMIVKKCEVVKVEAIVRGYITGKPMILIGTSLDHLTTIALS